MKKLILIILCLGSLGHNIYAQNIANGDFSINSGNDGVSCGDFGTFSDVSVPNWVRSHGTPNFQVISGNPPNNHMFLWTDGSGTEGILGNYAFKKTKSYCVKVNLSAWSTEFSGDEFKVYACTGLVRNLSLNSQCVSSMPALPSGAELIGTGTKQSSNAFAFNPVNDNNQIFIVYSTGGGSYNYIVISEVIIASFCKATLVFDNGQMPIGSQTAGNIYAGSSAGSGPNTVTNDPTNSTSLTASSAVFLMPNFIASASGSGSFIADIGPCDPLQCSNILARENPNEDENDSFISNKSLQENDIANDNISELGSISVYPNPNQGSFFVKLPSNENYEITVMNMTGGIIYQTITMNEQTKNIKLGEKTQPGSYIVRIKSKDLNVIKRVVISK